MIDNEIRRAEDAKRLMAEPLMVEAFAKVEEALIGRIKQVDVGATEAQRNLIVTLQLLGKVKQYLEQVIVTGKLAAMEEERKSWADRLRRRG